MSLFFKIILTKVASKLTIYQPTYSDGFTGFPPAGYYIFAAPTNLHFNISLLFSYPYSKPS